MPECICKPEHGSLDYGGPAYTGDKRCPIHGEKMPELSEHDALVALNQLRCNIVGTQSASWSNVAYPLVAILNKAGFELSEPTQEQMHEHLSTYGGAGGYPGNAKKHHKHDWNVRLVGARENLVRATRKYLADPSERHLKYLESALQQAEDIKR